MIALGTIFNAPWQDYLDDIVVAAIVVAAAVAVTRIGTVSVRRLQRQMEAAQSAKQGLALQRAATVAHSLNYAVRVVVWSLAFLMLLARANIELAPLIAGAGVAGVALGFGAQSIVRDYLAGFYLLVEDQLDVGDSVDVFVSGVKLTGHVTELTLRTTRLRTDDGQVHIIPNGGIGYVTNRSRGEGEVHVTVRLDQGEDADDVRRAVEELLDEVRGDASLRPAVFDGPAIRRIRPVGDAVEIDVGAVVRPERRWDLAAMLRDRLQRRLRPLPADVDVRVDAPDIDGDPRG